jgi:hypothetical protein
MRIVRLVVVTTTLLLVLVGAALPAQAQTTYESEFPVFGGELLIFSCDANTIFLGGQIEFFSRYGKPGQRSLGTYQLETVYSAEGIAYGGAVTAPKRADYGRVTYNCSEPTPPPAEYQLDYTTQIDPGLDEFVGCRGGYVLDAATVVVSNPEITYTVFDTGVLLVNETTTTQQTRVQFTCRLL